MAKKKSAKNQWRRSASPAIAPVALAAVAALAAGLLLDHTGLAGLGGGPDATTAALRFSEIQNHNAMTLTTADGAMPSWIEIENTGAEPVSLHGLGLARDDKVNKIFVFPDIALGAGEYVLVYADGTARAGLTGELHAPFGLSSAGGQTLYLFDNAQNILDSVEVPRMEADESYCRGADGSWSISVQATPGAANDVVAQRGLNVKAGDVEISEAAADNRTVFPDENGECGDYLELHNRTDRDVRLGGYWLSDNPAKPGKWIFPDVVLPAGGWLAVHCTGYDRGDDPAHLHTNFRLSPGESLFLADDTGAIISTVTLPETLECGQALSLAGGAWVTDIGPTPNRENTREAVLQMDAEARARRGSAVYISEVMAMPETEKYDWIELYNGGGEAVDLGGCGLSDRPDKPRKWQFPQGTAIGPGEYLAVFLTGSAGGSAGNYLAAPFAIPVEGGCTLSLTSASGGVMDSLYVPAQYSGVSFGRSDAGSCGYLPAPTPLAANGGQLVLGRAPAPEYSVRGGLFNSGDAFDVTMTAAPGARIYYTLDCTDPNEGSQLYDGTPISVSSNTVLRTKVYQDGWLPSYADAQSYLFDVQGVSGTPYVVSLVSDPDGLYSDERGIMVKGPHATSKFPFGNYGWGANFWMDWEREAHLELFTNTGETALSQGCSIKLHGRNTRAYVLKSFKVKAEAKYGSNRFSYPIFHDRPYDEYEAFVLRYTGQDYKYTFMRDVVLTSLARNTSVMYMEAEECICYLNGEYYSAMYIRENVGPFSLARREGWDESAADNMDLIKAAKQVMRGSNSTYSALVNWLGSHDTSTQEAYEVIDSAVDIDNFLEYCVLQIFIGTPDSINMKRYRCALTDGKWRFVLYDVDRGMRENINGFKILSQGTNAVLFKACMNNPTIRDRFLAIFDDALSSYLTVENVQAEVDAQFQRSKAMLPQYLKMMGISQHEYESRLKTLKTLISRRPKQVLKQCATYLGLSEAQMKQYFPKTYVYMTGGTVADDADDGAGDTYDDGDDVVDPTADA